MGLIDVLTNYGARKRAAHAAKTMKHGVHIIQYIILSVYINWGEPEQTTH